MLIHWYRLANWLYRKHIPLLPKLIYYIQYLLFNSSVPASCKIGGGYEVRIWRHWSCNPYQSRNRQKLHNRSKYDHWRTIASL